MIYRNYAVELHIKTDIYEVFLHEFEEEFTARRCYRRMSKILHEPHLYEVRLWNKNQLIESKSIR